MIYKQLCEWVTAVKAWSAEHYPTQNRWANSKGTSIRQVNNILHHSQDVSTHSTVVAAMNHSTTLPQVTN